ncbi:uncharacterized protein [Asterias amurensis]|uniref:uncharacterized protein n=1 Tax=Asterias amurensis TaxID=7602 RepID=UPI003AB45F1B
MSNCPQLRVECIVKLGGSAVTVKDRVETEKLDEIRKIAEFLKVKLQQQQQTAVHSDNIEERHQNKPCILVHGAGSFGHFQAKEYGVADGYHSNMDDEQIRKVKEGFCKTRISVTKLNHIIVTELNAHGVNAVGVSPCGGWETDDRRVVKSDIVSIQNLLAAGYLPVLHGDCVLDRQRGCTILSGDTIIEALCSEFNPKRVIFLADVDGIYDMPPSDPNSSTLPVVTVTEDGSITAAIATSCLEHDVTGGIQKKLKSATSIVTESKGATKVFVCRINAVGAYNAYTQGNLLGELGTEIRFQDSVS